MVNGNVTSEIVTVRLKIEAVTGRQLLIGPFGSLSGCRRLAEDLAGDSSIKVVSVESKHPWRGWIPVWTRTLGGVQ